MFWKNGDGLVSVLHDALRRLGGPVAEHALDVAAGAICRVAYGVIGTAAIQASCLRSACLAGVPGAGTLGLSLCCSRSARSADRCSLDLGGAAWWLFTQGPADGIRRFVSLLKQADAHRRCPEWVISGGAGRSATRQVKLNKRTLTARSAQLSFVQKLRFSANSLPLRDQRVTLPVR